MKALIKNFNKIFIITIILLATFLIGTPINESNVYPLYIALSLYTIIFYVIKIIKKEKIELNTLDIAVIVLAFSAIISLIFKTYVSLNDTIHTILKYFSILSIYLITSEECKKDQGFGKVLKNTIIISILILCVFGLDEITLNLLGKVKKFIGFRYVMYDEVRIGSLFVYPNVMAVVAGAGIFLCLEEVITQNSKNLKALYIVAIAVMGITLILTYSRLVYIMFLTMLAFYIVVLLAKKGKINKKFFISIGLVFLVAIIYVVIGLNVWKTTNITENYQKIFYSINSNFDYVFKFDVVAEAEKDDDFVIRITEKDEYFDDVSYTEISFGTYKGTKEIKVHTSDSTEVIYLNIEVKNKKSKLSIEKSEVNGENLILSYKLLPTKVVQKVEGISLKNKSAWERFVFIKDGLKLVKDNWFFGLGGHAWEHKQYDVQEYNYYTESMHCFYLQVAMENGLIGTLAVLAIIVVFVRKSIGLLKNNQIEDSGLIMAISLILIHSLLDFDMEFYYVLLLTFIAFAWLFRKSKSIKLNGMALYIVLIVTSCCNIYVPIVEMVYKENTKVIFVSSIKTEFDVYNEYYKKLPFSREIEEKRIRYINKEDKKLTRDILKKFVENEPYVDENVSLENIKKYINAEKSEETLNFAIEYIKSTQMYEKYNPNFQIERFKNLKYIIEMLNDEEAEWFKNQLKYEIDAKRESILDYKKCRYKAEKQEEYKEYLDRMIV